MAIQHTVVFRLTHEHGSAAESAFLDTARATLTGIDGVTEFTINKQVSAKSDLDWQFSMVFADRAAYDGGRLVPRVRLHPTVNPARESDAWGTNDGSSPDSSGGTRGRLM